MKDTKDTNFYIGLLIMATGGVLEGANIFVGVIILLIGYVLVISNR